MRTAPTDAQSHDAESESIEAQVTASLDKLGIPYELIRIDPDFADTAAFCEKYGYTLEGSANTIIVASKRGAKKHCACIVQGSERLDVNKRVKALMGVSRASFAGADETRALTGMMIGGVTAFALPEGLPVFADKKLLSQESVILGSGSRSSKIKIAPADIAKIPGAEFIEGLSL